jgi:subtilisin family serine protease
VSRRSRSAAFVAAIVAALSLVAFVPVAAAAPGPARAPEYWFDEWNIPALWASGVRGQGVTIAELDTGVNGQLPELAGNVLPGKDFGSGGGDGRVDREVSTFGHGTAMASIMVGHAGVLDITGIAPDAKLLPIAVPLTGTTDAGEDDHLPDAIRWAADHGAKIISMSLGGARKQSTDAVPCPAAEQAAVFYALQKGALLLAASGNNGTRGTVEEPGVCVGVVAVGAVDQNNVVADFSSRHPYLTLTAPGVDVPSLSRVPGVAFYGDGTSQATAIASAAIALVWSKFPQLSARQLLARVIATTDHHHSTRDPAYGFGVVNPARAVRAAVATTAPDPVYAAADPFLGRAAALAAAKQAPAPVPAPVDGSTGAYHVGHSPRLFAPRVVEGFAVSVAGLVALIVLAIVGVLRRRRRLRHPTAVRSATEAPPAESVPATSVDPTGTVWREIIQPPSGESDWFR